MMGTICVLLILIVLGVVSLKCLGYWIGLLIIVRWMEINQVPKPSDSKLREIAKEVIDNLVKDLMKFHKRR